MTSKLNSPTAQYIIGVTRHQLVLLQVAVLKELTAAQREHSNHVHAGRLNLAEVVHTEMRALMELDRLLDAK